MWDGGDSKCSASEYRKCRSTVSRRARTTATLLRHRRSPIGASDCTRVFRERASKVRDGVQLNCQNCNKLVTINRDTEDPFLRRAPKSAKEIRLSQEAKVFEAANGAKR
jgi:hypothetical protein